ncbi:putative bifunctional diguanylate cyclase/phosphodiesterase [Parasphingorhabdus sp.]|uniref:putative bifunctional diguanylate cyclase/phosphodiesterase n=1 Tax=Parasphingorhabdus sp. TaxID=2709688 RepID=UPI003A95348B
MRKYLKQLGGSTQSLVFTPLIVLTLIFGALALLLVINDAISIPLTSPLILGGTLAFVIAALVFARLGAVYVGHLERLVMTDSLSLLPNRRALHIDVQRHGTKDSELAIALIDLDGFKLVNDQYGHNVGDQVIKNCAAMLADLCGDDARCYRLGGDEFAIAMTGSLAGTIVEGISRSFIDLFKKPIIVDDRRIVIGASIGISCSRGEDRQNSSELLRRSDVAMYTSKRNGKMRCTWYQPEFDRNREVAQKIDGEMRRALSNDEFYVHYQPLVCAKTSKIVAVESLLRWARPDGQSMGPDVFIPIAEESGLINPIGLKVLRQACNDALAWDDITLSVNISPAQLRDVEFPIQLGQILEETGFPAERLELEITETCLVLDPVLAERTLDVIRGFGVNIALDDFGTGYASIGFLRMFRFEKLKLDRSLVVDAGEDEGSRAMMISSISVARALNMAVTAEGVETQQQADLARIAGCDHIQGWLFFKAMPPDEITHHLNQQNAQNDQTKLIG